MKIDKKAIGSNLRKLRYDKNVSLFKAAREIGISGNYLSQIERGEKIPSEAVLHSIGKYYDMNETELFLSYGKVSKENIKAIMELPELMKIMTKISLDKRLDEDYKDSLANELLDVYNKHYKKGGQ